jgi:hypothetical protein
MWIATYLVAAVALFWLGTIFANLGGLIFIILAAVLALLKIAGILAWSWWWVALPLWVALGGAFFKMRTAGRDP